jgi:hypothetical protein
MPPGGGGVKGRDERLSCIGVGIRAGRPESTVCFAERREGNSKETVDSGPHYCDAAKEGVRCEVLNRDNAGQTIAAWLETKQPNDAAGRCGVSPLRMGAGRQLGLLACGVGRKGLRLLPITGFSCRESVDS